MLFCRVLLLRPTSAAGMSYGDGTITNADVIRESGISDPSNLFKHMPASSMGKLVLSPHVYPGTLTGMSAQTVLPYALDAKLKCQHACMYMLQFHRCLSALTCNTRPH
jgi:hypothetical protein